MIRSGPLDRVVIAADGVQALGPTGTRHSAKFGSASLGAGGRDRRSSRRRTDRACRDLRATHHDAFLGASYDAAELGVDPLDVAD
jgi:hypothetical protein